ncbi:MAG: AraC family transcriptional regulator [Bryobacteraceae bacterium]|nr:AraC family transcriptional regulator [Bryobacteraceae bacterium]
MAVRYPLKDTVDEVIYETPLVTVGRFRCPIGHHLFEDSGPVSHHCFVFPREPVYIHHEASSEFLADPSVVTFYNQGARFRRRRLSPQGDRGEWFGLAPRVFAGHSEPFRFYHRPSSLGAYALQRKLVEAIESDGGVDDLLVEETVLRLLDQLSSPGAAPPQPVTGAEVAAAAREILALRFRDCFSLETLAAAVGVSVFRLCRDMKRHTGMTLHGYRTQLRLRAALEPLSQPKADLLQIALDLGFSTHSHFTESFRRAYGMPPSAFRAARIR